jgi:hypothetical protein
MRHAKHGQRRRAPVALKFSLTLFQAWLQSVLLPRDASPPITISGAVFWIGGRLLCLWGAPFSPRRDLATEQGRQELKIDRYLTKVREWTKASYGKFVASTAP